MFASVARPKIQTEMRDNMTRGELMTGMVVETRDGKKGIVLRDTPKGDIISGEVWMPLDAYTQNLLYDGVYGDTDEADIMKVYLPKNNRDFQKLQVAYDGIIWERDEEDADIEGIFQVLEQIFGGRIKITVNYD